MIERIDVLVHPFYSARNDLKLLNHPLYAELIKTWISSMKLVSQSPSMAMIVFSHCIDRELQKSKGIAQYENTIMKPYLSINFNNILRFSATDQNYRLSETFKERGLAVTGLTHMYVYGEVDDNACVQGWGRVAKARLNIEDTNYMVMHDWSVSSRLATAIYNY